MRFIKSILFLALSTLIVWACSEDSPKQEAPSEDLLIEAFSPFERPVDGVVTINLILHGLEQTEYMTVEKVNSAGKQRANYYRRVLKKEYSYEYTVLPTDDERFSFNFTLVGKDGSMSDVVPIVVYNSAGDVEQKYKGLSISNLRAISRVTGKEDNGHDGLPEVLYSVNNNTDIVYNIGGTELGISWEISSGYYGLFFGYTAGADFKPDADNPGPNGSSFRSNVMLFSEDTNLEDGLEISGAVNEGCEVFLTQGYKSYYTNIPTGAVHAAGREYVYCKVLRVGPDGTFVEPSRLFYSTSFGGTWKHESLSFWNKGGNFAQVSFCNIGDGYVYMIGTKVGYDSMPQLARVPEGGMTGKSNYEFWNGKDWVKGGETAAVTLIEDKAGELSFQYLPEFEKWVILYYNDPRYEIALRYADKITGPWSDPFTVVSGKDYPLLYGPYIHPLSKQEGGKLYFLMTMLLPYNTYLMSVDVKGF